jgi:putative transposase
MTQPDTQDITEFFHVAGRTHDGRHLLHRPRDYRAFLHALESACRGRAIRLLAYCVLPNEWHIVLGPVDPCEPIRLATRVLTTHARCTKAGAAFASGATQIRAVRDTSAIIGTTRFVERLAVRAGLVHRAEQWPWGSLADRLAPATALPLVSTAFLLSASWIRYVNTPLSVAGDDLAEVPGALARRPELSHERVRVVRSAYDDKTHAHVERPEHLGLVDAATVLQPLKDRWDGPTASVD